LQAFEEPTLLTGERDAIVLYNESAAELLGLHEELLGTPLPAVLKSLQAHDTAAVEQLLEGLPVGEGEAMAPVGLTRPEGALSGAWCVTPTSPDPECSWLLHRLRLAREEPLESQRVDFLANVTHELRTPLSALAATTELMLQDYQVLSSVELRKMIGLLHRNTRRLEAMVSNLLDAAALQKGRLQLRKTPTTVASLVRDAADFVLPLLDNKNQRLESKTIGEMPTLTVDPKRIVGVLVNLLSNASRYGAPNEPVQLRVANEGKAVRFTVRQRGAGIAKHEQALLFQRFSRTSSGEKVSGGSGLGLAIVKDVVELHGGGVGVLSKPGKATAFWFTLPINGSLQ
jgi:signal transduction histidine kinase